MTVLLDLPPDRIAASREGMARQDAEAVGRILLEAPDLVFEETAVDRSIEFETIDEYDSWLADLDTYLASIMGPDVPELSDYAISREGIYGDHP